MPTLRLATARLILGNAGAQANARQASQELSARRIERAEVDEALRQAREVYERRTRRAHG